MQSDALRNLFIRQTKTDKKDALIIAEVLRMGRYTVTNLPKEDIFKLKNLSRFYLEMMSNLLVYKQRLLQILDKVFPEYEKLFSDPLIKTSKELLKQGVLPEDLVSWDVGKLSRWLKRQSHGRLGDKKDREILDTAADSFGITLATDAFSFELRLLVEQIEFSQKQLTDLADKLAEMVEKLQTPLTTIPGIGRLLAACILGEIGDTRRFSKAKKLVAFASLDATVCQSGEFLGTRAHISKRGSPYLRRVLWLAANVARRCNPIFKAFYEKKLAEGKHPQVVIGAVAKKLCLLIHACLSKNEPFNPDYQWKSGS